MSMAGVFCYAQPSSFFGLEFGQVYPTEQIKEAVGSKGTFYEGLQMENDAIIAASDVFTELEYDGKVYPVVAFSKLKNGKFILFEMIIPDEEGSPEGLDDEFAKLKAELAKQGEMSLADSGVEGMERYTVAGMISTRLDKYVEEGKTVKVNLSYLYTLGVLSMMLEDNPLLMRPEIQDEFFGLKMGSRLTEASVKAAVGSRGTFSETTRDGNIDYSFKNITFAGKTWSFGDFMLSPDGRFYYFNVYDSLPDYSDERKDAEFTYSSLKKRLDDKYGEEKENMEEDGKYVVYAGSNNMAVHLSNKRSRSIGGTYRRFVTLTYMNTEISNQVSSANDNEL